MLQLLSTLPRDIEKIILDELFYCEYLRRHKTIFNKVLTQINDIVPHRTTACVPGYKCCSVSVVGYYIPRDHGEYYSLTNDNDMYQLYDLSGDIVNVDEYF